MNKIEIFFNSTKSLFILPDSKKLTYKNFYNKSLNFAKYYQHQLRFKKNKTVFLRMERTVDFYIAFIGLTLLEATIVPVSKKINPSEVLYLKKIYKPILEINSLPANINKLQNENFSVGENFLKNAKVIFFSSGTTGKPKGIRHNIFTLVESAKSFSKLSRYKKEDIILHNWPHYYMAGFFNMFLCPLISGCTIYFDEEIGINTYLKYWQQIKKNKISLAYLSPTMSKALINYSKYNKFSYKNNKIRIISTGSYLYQSIYKEFKDIFNIRLLNCYGVTEIGASIGLTNKNLHNSIGSLSKGISIKLSKKNEILVNSKYLFEGYVLNNNVIKKFRSKFFNTHDLAIKKNSDYFIIGRNKEIIKKGGEQVSLLKIEDAALYFQGIKEVLAKGVKSVFWGEEIHLEIVVDKKIKEKKLFLSKFSQFLSQKLTRLEIPSKISYVKSIRKTSIGKNYRRIF